VVDAGIGFDMDTRRTRTDCSPRAAGARAQHCIRHSMGAIDVVRELLNQRRG
jgi:hypothetical protein